MRFGENWKRVGFSGAYPLGGVHFAWRSWLAKALFPTSASPSRSERQTRLGQRKAARLGTDEERLEEEVRLFCHRCAEK